MVGASMSHHSWDKSKSWSSAPAATYADACTQTVAPAPSVPVAESMTFVPVIEYIAPAPALIYAAFSQRLSPVYITTTVTTDDNLDITGLTSPQSFGTAREASAPQAIVSVHQEQLVVQEQVTVQEISRYVAPATVIQNFAPTSAVTSDAHSQQLPPVYTTTTVTTDDNLDMTDLVNPQFSSTAVEPFPPHVVGPLPPFEESTEPVYSQAHQNLIAAGEMTENIAEVGDILVPPIVGETIEVLPRSIATADAVPAHVDEFIAEAPDVTLPHEKYDGLSKMPALKQADLRQAKFAVQRLQLHAAVSGQACDANLVSDAKQAHKSGKMVLGNLIREIDALRPRATAECPREETAERAAAEPLRDEEVAAPKTKKARKGKRWWCGLRTSWQRNQRNARLPLSCTS